MDVYLTYQVNLIKLMKGEEVEMLITNFDLKDYLSANAIIEAQYKQILVADCQKYNCDSEETESFINECLHSVDHFQMFMPEEYQNFVSKFQ